MHSRATLQLFALATVVFCAIVFFAIPGQASDKAGIVTGEFVDTDVAQQEGWYTSPVLTAERTFHLVGFTWQGDRVPEADIRYYSGSEWSAWFHAEADDYIQKDGWFYSVDPVVAPGVTRIQYRIEDAAGIDAVRLVYLSLERGTPLFQNIWQKLFSAVLADEVLDVIPRSGWGADEEWRFDGEDKEVWEPE